MDIFFFVIFFAACAAAGVTGAAFPPGPWYQALKKPAWTPPNWLFPVAWTTLYFLMSISAARIAGEVATSQLAAIGLAFWALQIALNGLWSPVFFGLRRLGAAMGVLGALWVAVAATTVTFWSVDWIAGLMFLPYLIWVSVAGALNLSVWRLNPDVEPLVINA
ncbi:MAG: TspO/MBR family protein [Pseudomonadota bacterium]